MPLTRPSRRTFRTAPGAVLGTCVGRSVPIAGTQAAGTASALLLAAWAAVAATAPTGSRAAETAEPRIQVRVAEDDKVRIEEVRVRGEVRRVVVRQKAASAPDYEIVPLSGAQDPSLRRGQSSGSGERVWRLFSF